MTEILNVNSLSKKIGGKTILNQVDFTVEKGQILGLLGPNGAGKTTVIRTIVGLMRPTEGQILIGGFDMKTKFTAGIAEVGAIIENPEFYNYLTGYESLSQYARMAKKEISKARIDEVVALVKLETAINQKVKTYSLGMRQRLGVAQAILHAPQLLLLDEPMNGLDPKGMHDFRDIMKQLAENGTSILISSHILSDIEVLCDQLVVLEKGNVTYKGALTALNQPANQNQISVHLETTDNVAAQIFLEKLSYLVSTDGAQLKLVMAADDRAQIIRELVRADFDVLSVSLDKVSLEENFIAFTEKGADK